MTASRAASTAAPTVGDVVQPAGDVVRPAGDVMRRTVDVLRPTFPTDIIEPNNIDDETESKQSYDSSSSKPKQKQQRKRHQPQQAHQQQPQQQQQPSSCRAVDEATTDRSGADVNKREGTTHQHKPKAGFKLRIGLKTKAGSKLAAKSSSNTAVAKQPKNTQSKSLPEVKKLTEANLKQFSAIMSNNSSHVTAVANGKTADDVMSTTRDSVSSATLGYWSNLSTPRKKNITSAISADVSPQSRDSQKAGVCWDKINVEATLSKHKLSRDIFAKRRFVLDVFDIMTLRKADLKVLCKQCGVRKISYKRR